MSTPARTDPVPWLKWGAWEKLFFRCIMLPSNVLARVSRWRCAGHTVFPTVGLLRLAGPVPPLLIVGLVLSGCGCAVTELETSQNFRPTTGVNFCGTNQDLLDQLTQIVRSGASVHELQNKILVAGAILSKGGTNSHRKIFVKHHTRILFNPNDKTVISVYFNEDTSVRKISIGSRQQLFN